MLNPVGSLRKPVCRKVKGEVKYFRERLTRNASTNAAVGFTSCNLLYVRQDGGNRACFAKQQKLRAEVSLKILSRQIKKRIGKRFGRKFA